MCTVNKTKSYKEKLWHLFANVQCGIMKSHTQYIIITSMPTLIQESPLKQRTDKLTFAE